MLRIGCATASTAGAAEAQRRQQRPIAGSSSALGVWQIHMVLPHVKSRLWGKT
jgi:hypothetical protein